MARKSIVVKQQKLLASFLLAKKEGRPFKGSVSKVYNRCSLCGRPRGYLRDFGICRCCFREFAEKAQIPGIRKSSW